MIAVEYIFWSSAFLIFYSYAGYPLLIWAVSLLKRRGNARSGSAPLPKVTLIVSAYNESDVIEDKILNSLASDYPLGLLEVVVVSDGSTDGTNETVERYSSRGVVLRNYEGRIGKTMCLNRAVPLAGGEIIVFSDANSRYDRMAIRNLVGSFTDGVGFVTGVTRYGSKDGAGVAESVGIYSKVEILTKKFESRLGSCVGADGAIFAIRKDLFRPLNAYDINDFVIPLNVIKQGWRGVQCSEAFCVEDTAGSAKGEFNRQVRITNRTLRALFNNAGLFNPFRYGFFAIEIISHKLLKLSVPFLMVLILGANLALASKGPLYAVALGLQAVFYAAALSRHMVGRLESLSRVFSISHTFTAINIAILVGWVKYLKGETYVTWSPTQR